MNDGRDRPVGGGSDGARPAVGWRGPGPRRRGLFPLRQIRCLSRLSQEEMEKVASQLKPSRHPKGRVLLRQGDEVDRMMIVVEGSVKLTQTVRGRGRPQVLEILGRGDCVCATCPFGKVPSPVTAQCLKPSRLLTLTREASRFLDARVQDLSGVVSCLQERLLNWSRLVGSRGDRSPARSLAGLLLELARRHGTAGHDGLLVDLGMSHEDLAQCVGTAREVVSRALESMERRGIVQVGRNKVLVRHSARLRAVADGEPFD